MKIPSPAFRRARIEIVPMIDTIFFLLVFFMIASLSMTQVKGPRVTLPDSDTAALRPTHQVVLTLTDTGTTFIDRNPVTEAEIIPVLARRVRANPSVTVLINCDKSQPVSQFLRLFDLAKQANAGHVVVATLPRGMSAVTP